MQVSETEEQSNYLRHLTNVGDQRAITAQEDVYSTSGIKVLAAGSKINTALLERLLKHKLIKSIDESCVVDHALNRTELVDQARRLLESSPELARLVQNREGSDFFEDCFGGNELPNLVRNKLTVLGEQSRRMLEHSIWCGIAAAFLGREIGLPEQEIQSLASAGLLHDIGQLHIDQRVLDYHKPLDASLRRQVQAHPLIAYGIVTALNEYDQSVAQAILDHHERIDGSGYPRGLEGDQISLHGKILSFTEFILGVLESAGFRHLAIIIKTYGHQFDAQLTRIFWNHFKTFTLPDDYPFDVSETSSLYRRLNVILDGWQTARQGLCPEHWMIAEKSINAVHHALSRAGLERALIDELSEAPEQNSRAHQEACSVIREGLRQVRETAELLDYRCSASPEMQAEKEGIEWVSETLRTLNR